MFTRSIIRLTLALIIVVSAVLLVTSFTANAAATAVTARPRADLIVNPGESIQAAIDAANDGDTILINAGDYTESLTLSKPVSLTGVNSDTTIIHAMAGQRVLTVTGATISNSVVISGLTFTGGSANNGGGAYLDAPLMVANARFISNTALQSGGGLYASEAVTLTNIEFISNTAQYRGGGFACGFYLCSLKIANTFFLNNTAGDGGGGLYSEAGPIVLVDSRFEGNVSHYLGGGLMRSQCCAMIYMTDTQFISNTAIGFYGGGGAFAGPVTISGGRFERNVSTGSGGGGLFGAGTISGTSFISNSANAGGGFYGSGTIINARFEGNQAAINDEWLGGGGAVAAGGGETVISRTQFVNNFSAIRGGAVSAQGTSGLKIVDSLFTDNVAPEGTAVGDVSYLGSVGNISLLHVTIADTLLNPASAVSILSFTAQLTNTIIANHAIGICNTGGIVTEDYNLFYGNLTNTVGVTMGAHSLIGDPRFIDPAHDDYHLAFGSAAIDHGVDAGVYTDLDGNARPHGAGFDIGAYEFANDTRYVATTGDDASNLCLDQLSPCSTVQHAIDVANDGDQVLIASGLYTQSATLSKPVALTGVNSDTTILHAVAGQRVLTVTGATISNSVVISGLTFTGGSADYGGGLYSDYTVTLINMRFISNTATIGGGVLTQAGATISGSQFIENQAGAYSGGGLACVNYNCSLSLCNTSFLSNTAAENGGGLYTWAGPVTLVNSRFEGNVSYGDGGGLARSQCCDMIYMTDTQFISNTAIGFYGGGGVFAEPVTVSGGRFERNVSTFGGGGGLLGVGMITISGTLFISNSAYAGGGFSGYGTLVNARFEGNRSTAQDEWLGGGGAVVTFGSELTVISQTRFINNVSATRGGAVSAQGSNELRIIDSLFINNAAREGTAVGDVSYLGGIGNISLIHATIADTQLNPASAVSVLSFTAQLTDTLIANHAIGISNTGGTVTEDYNLFYGNLINTVGVTMGAHSLIGDPRFIDPAHDNYHLAFGSAAIDHGVDAGVYTDLDVNARPQGAGFDIGAYECQGPTYRAFLPVLRR